MTRIVSTVGCPDCSKPVLMLEAQESNGVLTIPFECSEHGSFQLVLDRSAAADCFCGHGAPVIERGAHVECEGCGLVQRGETTADAVKAWNVIQRAMYGRGYDC